MLQLRNFGDYRQRISCTYCGSEVESRDHVPSKVLLDEPYPENLPVVPACLKCNQDFSVDEEYFACLIDCLIAGSASPAEVSREKVRTILLRKPELTARLNSAIQVDGSSTYFVVEEDRIRNVLLKLARGHALFELNEPQNEEPQSIMYAPLFTMHDRDRNRFEELPNSQLLPEAGSRAMQRLLVSSDLLIQPEWIIAQPNRYRYTAFVEGRIVIRIVISEYLACEIVW